MMTLNEPDEVSSSGPVLTMSEERSDDLRKQRLRERASYGIAKIDTVVVAETGSFPTARFSLFKIH